MTTIENLEAIINDPNTSPINKTLAQEQLNKENERLASIGGARLQAAQMTGTADADVLAILDAIEKLLKQSGTGGGGTVNAADVRKVVLEEMAKRKILESDLSTDLRAWIESTKKVAFSMPKLLGASVSNVKQSTLSRPLTQLILSDIMARNNTYLYGGAGTGKTFIAEEIAEMLGWTKITLNCNQFTSPLDILGGQTIDGYQEGKLSIAWGNKFVKPDGTIETYKGCVLILDELPKIDPNTAGILNEALAKIKDYKVDEATKVVTAPTIRNGKNEVIALGNLYVIATGNVPLNTIDPDYEANFKQDLSLQDRFIGSTYRVFVDYNFECNTIMKGFAFIWIYLTKVREKIESLKAGGQAFVSLRLMINVKATYIAYRDVLSKTSSQLTQTSATIGDTGTTTTPITQAVSSPKTIIESMEFFFGLFKPAIKDTIIKDTNFDAFKRIVAEKNKMPYDPDAPNFDTQKDIDEATIMINNYISSQKKP